MSSKHPTTSPLNLVPLKKRSKQSRGTWTSGEDEALTKAVEQHGAKNWKKIAESVAGRSDVQCLHRWQKVLNPDLVKGPWTEEEDNKVRDLVKMHGPKKWSVIASYLPGRIGKQCRERWTNHLDPSIKKGNWEPWEDELIIKLQRDLGNKWARIAKHLPGRTDNAVKNRFNSTISRRIRQQKTVGGYRKTRRRVLSPNVHTSPAGSDDDTEYSPFSEPEDINMAVEEEESHDSEDESNSSDDSELEPEMDSELSSTPPTKLTQNPPVDVKLASNNNTYPLPRMAFPQITPQMAMSNPQFPSPPPPINLALPHPPMPMPMPNTLALSSPSTSPLNKKPLPSPEGFSFAEYPLPLHHSAPSIAQNQLKINPQTTTSAFTPPATKITCPPTILKKRKSPPINPNVVKRPRLDQLTPTKLSGPSLLNGDEDLDFTLVKRKLMLDEHDSPKLNNKALSEGENLEHMDATTLLAAAACSLETPNQSIVEPSPQKITLPQPLNYSQHRSPSPPQMAHPQQQRSPSPPQVAYPQQQRSPSPPQVAYSQQQSSPSPPQLQQPYPKQQHITFPSPAKQHPPFQPQQMYSPQPQSPIIIPQLIGPPVHTLKRNPTPPIPQLQPQLQQLSYPIQQTQEQRQLLYPIPHHMSLSNPQMQPLPSSPEQRHVLFPVAPQLTQPMYPQILPKPQSQIQQLTPQRTYSPPQPPTLSPISVPPQTQTQPSQEQTNVVNSLHLSTLDVLQENNIKTNPLLQRCQSLLTNNPKPKPMSTDQIDENNPNKTNQLPFAPPNQDYQIENVVSIMNSGRKLTELVV